MINEIYQFFKQSNHVDASALEFVGSINSSTNDDNAEIFLIPQDATGQNPTRGSRVGGMTKMAFAITVGDGSPALADFALLVKTNKEADIVTLLSGSDWGTITGILKHKVGSLNTLAAGATGYGYVDIGPCYSIAFQAKSAGTELLTNGTFTGSANSWTLGTGIAYGTNNVAFTAATATLSQTKADMVSSGAGWVDGQVYEVTFTISGYSAGNLAVGTVETPSQYKDADGVEIQLGNGTYTALVESDGDADGLIFTATGFTGVIDSVSMKQCATVRIAGSAFH